MSKMYNLILLSIMYISEEFGVWEKYLVPENLENLGHWQIFCGHWTLLYRKKNTEC